jgi:hypothetical protein
MSNLEILTYIGLAGAVLAMMVYISENRLFDLIFGLTLFISFIVFA